MKIVLGRIKRTIAKKLRYKKVRTSEEEELN